MISTQQGVNGMVSRRAAIALVAVLFSVMAAPQARAVDPRGDWSRQRDLTRGHAINRCGGDPFRVIYDTSGPYGESSRYFNYHVWNWNPGSFEGYTRYKISNNYVIWSIVYTDGFGP